MAQAMPNEPHEATAREMHRKSNPVGSKANQGTTNFINRVKRGEKRNRGRLLRPAYYKVRLTH